MGNISTDQDLAPKRNPTKLATLCVGIPTIQRHEVSYLKSTLGSLQHGLKPEGHGAMHFVVSLHTSSRANTMNITSLDLLPWLTNSLCIIM